MAFSAAMPPRPAWSGRGTALRDPWWWRVAPLIFVGILLLGLAGRYLTAVSEDYAHWWVTPVLPLVLLLITPRHLVTASVAAIFVGVAAANLLAGRTLLLAGWFGAASIVEATIALIVLTDWFRRPARLDTAEDAGRLLTASLAAAVSLGLVAATGISIGSHHSFAASAVSLAIFDMTTLVVLVPLVLLIRADPAVRRSPIEIGLQYGVLLALSVVGNFDPHGRPLLFLPWLPLVWATLRFRSRVVALELLTIDLVMMLGFYAERGPFAVSNYLQGGGAVIALQASMLAIAIVAMPIVVGVNQRRRALVEVSASRDELQSVLDGAQGVAVVAADTEGRIVVWSNGATRMFGYSRNEALQGLRIPDLYDPDAGPMLAFEELTAPLRSGVPSVALDRNYRRKNGTPFVGHLQLSRRYGPDGSTIGYMGVVEDVGEARRAEAALREAFDRELEAVERLAALDRSKNDFIASVSHELRTPITNIIGYTDLLASRATSPDDRRLLEPVMRNVRRLELLIEDLLTVSRMEGGTLVYRPEPMDLRAAVRAAAVAADVLRRSRGQTLNLELPSSEVPVKGDGAQLERALTQLLSNAVKFTPDGGRIDVCLTVDGDKASITVSDTGMGIPVEEQPWVFEPFYRAPRATEEAVAGTGIGLHILSEVVEAHGGTVSFESAEGSGTTFTVCLPMRVD